MKNIWHWFWQQIADYWFYKWMKSKKMRDFVKYSKSIDIKFKFGKEDIL